MTTANSQFFAILTAVGEAKQANANALGVPWTFSQLGVGDANLTEPVPSREQTRLINERRRAPLNQLKVDPANPNLIVAEQVIPPDVGGWWIREIGLYDADGDLVAVANCAPSFKPLLNQGTGKTQVVRLNIIVTSTANVQLKIDPAVVLATRSYVDAAILEVLPKNKTPGEYTRVKINDRGLVVSGDNPTTLAGNGISDAYTKEQVDAIIAQASALPVGAMVAFPVDKVAPGFLEVDGSVKSIAAYPDLAAFLGTTFNKGDEGAGNFRLPESRGEFLRGWDHWRGVDTGRAIGSCQAATAIRPVASDVAGSDSGVTVGTQWADADSSGLTPPATARNPNGSAYTPATADNSLSAASLNGTVSNTIPMWITTRPRNLAVMWCIKAWNAPINQGSIDIAALAVALAELTANGPVVGSARGARMSVPVDAAKATFSADQIVVQDANGKSFLLKNFSKLIDLSSSSKGLGAMDIGAAPINGYVALYALFNPVTKQQGAIAVDATFGAAPNLYAGAVPAGYTASALMTVVPTNDGGQFKALVVQGRDVSPLAVLSYIGAEVITKAPISLAEAVPLNAVSIEGLFSVKGTAQGALSIDLYSNALGVGIKRNTSYIQTGGINSVVFENLKLTIPQTIYMSTINMTAGTPEFVVYVTGYRI